ncbi:unnamed protein product [Cuscuta europaea]|uniref:Protein kinase domain-containing protein n=1 Tax=Cuscuta europaea TaxID=41803 RepID=A0A9P0ZTY4_CUSEU|nr:unnamed protein product [Cuscuta europaea]
MALRQYIVSIPSRLMPLLLVVFLLHLPVRCQSRSEAEILLQFRDSLDNAAALSTWNASIPPCMGWSANWENVVCVNGHVHGVNLNNKGFGGTIDVDTLAELPDLRSFSAMNNSFEGDIPAFYRLGTLKNLKLSHNKFSGEIVDSYFSGMRSLKKLYLSNNQFTGPIPGSLVVAKRLLELRLENNAFDGKIPFLHLPRLVFVNLSNNGLEGEIPTTLSHFSVSSFQGNNGLCGEPLNPCILNPELSMATLIIAGIVVGSAVLAIVAVIFILRQRNPADLEEGLIVPSSHRRMASVDLDKLDQASLYSSEHSSSTQKGDNSLRLTFLRDDSERFDLASLLKASAEILGSGVFGSTYKATLSEGPVLVVKRFREMNNAGKEEFYEHMRRLGSLTHPNILSLTAFYYRKEEKLLVANYVQNVSLAVHLHGNKSSGNECLDWSTRLKIVKGITRGLMYLYTELPDLIAPHGHLKSSNVLLNTSFQPLLNDYGLLPVINIEHAQTHMIAYKSLEYQKSARISKKTDVWALGILIVETLTGKLPSGFLQNGDADLTGWIRSVVPDEENLTREVFDKDMKGITEESEGQIRKLLRIGLRCCEVDVDKRLDIKEAVERIEEVRERDGEFSDLNLNNNNDESLSLLTKET